MNLVKAIGTIGGLTMVSRVLGFARDMIGSRILGASHANDAFNVAFTLPNIFRRLFGEGAFASGFVPLFSRRLASGGQPDRHRPMVRRCSAAGPSGRPAAASRRVCLQGRGRRRRRCGLAGGTAG